MQKLILNQNTIWDYADGVDFCKHLKSAILSMQEMVNREKGCEYCIDISKYCGFGYAEWFEHKAANDVYEISIDVKFCPNCGRKLKGD